MRVEFHRKGIGGILLYIAMVVAAGWLTATGGCATVPDETLDPVSVDEIVDMSKAGTPTDQIIQEIAESHTVYRLTASQLADLEKRGVAPAVIDYMQQTYLDAVQKTPDLVGYSYWTQEEDGYFYGGLPYGWDPNILP